MSLRRCLIAVLLSLAVILAASLSACSRGETSTAATAAAPAATPSPTPTPAASPTKILSASEILADSLAAQKKAGPFALGIKMALNVEVVGGTEPGKFSLGLTGGGSFDQAGKQMQMNAVLTVAPPNQAEQKVSFEVYLLNGWVYAGYAEPGQAEQWTKVQITEDMWKKMGEQDVLSALFLTAVNASLGDNETINGVSYYVVNLTPNTTVISALLKSQLGAAGPDLSGIDFNKFLQPLVFKSWIDQSSFLPLKQSLNYALTLTPQDIAASLGKIPEASAVPGDLAGAFDQVSLKLSADLNYLDYGKPLTINLPPAAQSAPEMSLPALEPSLIPTPTR